VLFRSPNGTGNVGVGLTNPVEKLHVAGDINVGSGYGFRINDGASAGYYLRGDGTRFIAAQIADSDVPTSIVRTSRNINTTSPLSGGGDLSVDRTLSIGGLSSLGAANQLVGVNSGAGAWEYKTLSGTSNRISVTHGAGTITLNAPQDIHTAATPTFGGLTIPWLKPASDAVNAVQLQTVGGVSVLDVDTSNQRIGIGTT
jgi:hypothetical protein